jgi:RNA polymerase sigma factor (sigma-70 family)
MTQFNIILKVKPKHGKIHRYMTENKLSLGQMSELLEVSKSSLYSILNFRWQPNINDSRSAKTIKKLEAFFNCSIDEIFPPELSERIKSNAELRALLQGENVSQREIDIEYMPFESLPEVAYRPDYDDIDVREKIAAALETLPPTWEKVLRMRFGIDEEKDYTLEEVGMALGVTRARVRKIEQKALMRLRDSSKAKVLKELAQPFHTHF